MKRMLLHLLLIYYCYLARTVENITKYSWQVDTSKDTTSFRHSCMTLPKLVNYLTNGCKFCYMLTSFVHNNPIEHHFGLYRQMSGSNYNVSVCQVLEKSVEIVYNSETLF